jgi:nitroreductase
MSDIAPKTADLFEIIRTTRSMRRLKPDPVPSELLRKILEACVRRAVATCSAGGSW